MNFKIKISSPIPKPPTLASDQPPSANGLDGKAYKAPEHDFFQKLSGTISVPKDSPST